MARVPAVHAASDTPFPNAQVVGNLSALMHTPIVNGVTPLAAVMTLACSFMAVSLLGLIAAGFFQFRMEQLDAPTA